MPSGFICYRDDLRVGFEGCSVTGDGLDRLFEGLPPTLDPGAVAELLGMTKQGVYIWLRDGVIPGYQVRSTWFVLRDELKETMRAGSNTRAGSGRRRKASKPVETSDMPSEDDETAGS